MVRHGRHSDVGVRLTGRGADKGLTADGVEEARGAAAILSRESIAAVYASPRRRTFETAELIAARHGIPVRIAAPLDEIDFGRWTGRSFTDLDSDPAWVRWNSERSNAGAPGGESMAEAQARAVGFVIEAAARHSGVVLVTHCDIIRALLCWEMRRSLDDIHAFEAEPGSVTPLSILAEEPVAA